MTTPEALFSLFVALAAFALGAHWERRREWEWLERQRSELKREQESLQLDRLIAKQQPEQMHRIFWAGRDGVFMSQIGDKN